MQSSATRSTARERRSLESLSRSFRTFADAECRDEPIYAAICRFVSDHEPTLMTLWEAPLVQQRPNLLLAAVHDLVLSGVIDPIRAYFPSVGGTRVADAELVRAFASFVLRFDNEIRERLSTRSTQTNEIGRCAVLEPCLAVVAAAMRSETVALFDLGSSAGLHLAFDEYHLDYGEFSRGLEKDDAVPSVSCAVRGEAPFATLSKARLSSRVGADLAPVNLEDELEIRWLRACIWPSDLARAESFETAIAVSRRAGHRVLRIDDWLEAIETWLDGLAPEELPVVFHSWVLYYFSPDERVRFVTEMERLVRERSIVWLSAESEALQIRTREAPARFDSPGTTSWAMRSRAGEALLASAHSHGKWIEWRAPLTLDSDVPLALTNRRS